MQIDEKYHNAICFQCKHLNFNPKEFNCKAFEEIPEEILVGENNHSKPLADQGNKIVFEKE